MIEFNCASCNRILRVSDDKAGCRGHCPSCGMQVEVPLPDADVCELAEEDLLDDMEAASSRLATAHKNEKAVYRIQGLGDNVVVYHDKLTITPVGFMGFIAKGLKGTKTISLSSITAIQHKRAGALDGYLQFSILGGVENQGGWFAAGVDENTFRFDRSENEHVEEANHFIERRIQELRVLRTSTRPGTDPADQIAKLAKLRQQGHLSDAEFQEAKAKILRSM